MLLAALIRARALHSAKPYCYRCVSSSSSSAERNAFLRGKTYSKTHETLHAHPVWRKISYFNICKRGAWPIGHAPIRSPTIRFHENVQKLVHICIVSVRKKKSLVAISENSPILTYSCVLVRFCPFHRSYFNELLLGG